MLLYSRLEIVAAITATVIIARHASRPVERVR